MVLSPLARDWLPLIARAEAALRRDVAGVPEVLPRGAPLLSLLDQVVTWNRRVDLTAARSAEELLDLYLADACVLAAFPSTEHWVDVGSGGGAPGVVLALLRPELTLTLVEPRAKRVAFLRNALSVLQLAARVVRGRSEELAARSYDTAVSRATLPPTEWLSEGVRLANKEVWVLLAQNAAPRCPGWEVDQDISYRWPLTGVARRAVRYVPRERG